MDFLLLKHVRKGAALAVWVGVVWMGVAGIHRGLWLDEAWVANSLRSATWGEMWWGGEWLQTSPPLFLALGRVWLAVAGLSVEALRVVPLVFALVTVGAVMAASPARWRALAAVALFAGVGPEYFFSFKQFGAEAAAVAVVLWVAAERRSALVAVTALLLPLAYPIAFLLPGLAWLMEPRKRIQAAVIWGAVLAALYWAFVRPNVEPALWTYWGSGAWDAPMLAWMVASVGLSAYALWRRDWWMLACALPCVLLAGAEATGWYPASPRMRLFARPAIVLAAVRFAEREVRWAWVGWVPGAVAVVWMGVTVAGYRTEPFENYAGAMAELRAKAGPGDLVLVHAGARQGFLLETAIEGWQREVTFGGTGWPCCARGRALEKSSEAAVRADLERMIPADYRGRVWLVYANRPLHWQYLGLDEGDLWRRAVWERGCPPAGYTDVGNAVVAPMECNSR